MSDLSQTQTGEDPIDQETQTDLENKAVAEEALTLEEVPEEQTGSAAMMQQLQNQQVNPAALLQNIPQVDPQQLQQGLQNAGQALQNYANPNQQQQPEPQPNVVSEVAAAVGGGALDAVDSVTGFAELTGDTLKHGLNQVLGRPSDPSQNPFHEDYVARDIEWLDIPEEWKPENHTGWGNFARGMVEFGLLTAATGAVGGAAGGTMKGVGILRSANTAVAGNKYLRFLDKGAKVFAEGAVADLISSSSEAGNIANLAEEFIPQFAPDIMYALAVRPEDNPWHARLKTVLAGGGMNHVFWGISAYGKGLWKHIDEIKRGVDPEDAAAAGNIVYREEMAKGLEADEFTATQKAAQNYAEGKGIGQADSRDEFLRQYLTEEDYLKLTDPATDAAEKARITDIADKTGASQGDDWDAVRNQSRQQLENPRELDPHVNPEQFHGPERASYSAEPGAVKKNVRESIQDMKQGGPGRSYTNIVSEPQMRAISRGNLNFKEYIAEVANDISDAAFKDLDNRLDYNDIKKLILRQATPLIDMIDDFKGGKDVDLAKNFKKALEDPNNKRVYMDDGVEIVTTTPALKGANVLALNALARTVSDLSSGAVSISSHMPLGRQAEMIFDAMKVLLTENKKMGMMWGLDGKAQQWGFKLPKTVKELTEKRFAEFDQQMDEYFEALYGLVREERWQEVADVMALNKLSDGHVRTMAHVHEFLQAKIRGGRMDDIHIQGMARKQLQGTFFNSILGAPRTIRKSILGTNTIAMLRPVQAWVGAKLPWSQLTDADAAVAVAQIQAISRAWSESWQMARRNYELGATKQNPDYVQKFELEQDLREWKNLRDFYERYPADAQLTPDVNGQLATYEMLDKIVDFNTSPWVKYSQNFMGGGDAFARTVIGRIDMAKKAAIDAMEKGADLDDLGNIVKNTEENFRKEIFDKNADGFWIVKNKASLMAGDEAAMTKSLEQNFSGFENIAKIPGMKVFFPLVRPGFNFLDLTFQHTFAMRWRDKYHDLVWRPQKTGEVPSQLILNKYGIQANELAQEVALIQGRMAMGNAVIVMGAAAAMNGMLTGSMPHDKTDRDLWKLNNIQPNSIKIGDTYVPFVDNMLVPEVFAPLMTMVANVFAYQDVLGESQTDDLWEKLRWIAASMIVDQSMLSGIGDLAMVLDPNQGGIKSSQYVASRIIRSHFPGAALGKMLGDMADNTQKEANTLWEMIKRADIGAKSTLPAKYDILSKDRSGKKLHYGPENGLLRLFNSLSPIAIVPTDGDPLRKTLQEIRYNLPEVLSQIGGVELNSLERSELQRILSQSTLRADLERVMKTADFKSSLETYRNANLKEADDYELKDHRFYTLVHDVFKQHKERAKWILIQDNPDLAQRIILKDKKKNLGRNNMDESYYRDLKNQEKLLKLKNYATNP